MAVKATPAMKALPARSPRNGERTPPATNRIKIGRTQIDNKVRIKATVLPSKIRIITAERGTKRDPTAAAERMAMYPPTDQATEVPTIHMGQIRQRCSISSAFAQR